MNKPIQNALISVYHKEGLAPILKLLHEQGTNIYSSGGTFQFISDLGFKCNSIEDLTGFPEILDGRVKTLHPKIFGGLLARTELEMHRNQLATHGIPAFDLMICDLYPFEEYLANHASEAELIEKIDIGGVSLIRAAAKNFNDVICIAHPECYSDLIDCLSNQANTIDFRRKMSAKAFEVIAHYDTMISSYFRDTTHAHTLRYGENPHQRAKFVGALNELIVKLNGKEISYNNILDIDAAMRVIAEFDTPTFAIIKHNNTCGLASDPVLATAYQKALAGDPVSAFGGVLVTNHKLDADTARLIDNLFFEVLICPEYDDEALSIITKKKNRIVIKQLKPLSRAHNTRTALNGILIQDSDTSIEGPNEWKQVSGQSLTPNEVEDLKFAIKAVKHLKSNAIAIVKNQQLIGMGCGMVSRIDALRHAIAKAKEFGLDLIGSAMASDAFFPFTDCVNLAHSSGIALVAQPGGSIKDQECIDYCIANGLKMVMTGKRHFNH